MVKCAALVAMFLAVGCASSVAPISNNTVTGTWAESVSVPGASLVLVLQQTGTSIAGTGTFSIEAGRSGTVQVTGASSQSAVNLTIQYDFGASATFTGALTDSQRLTGTLTQNGSPPQSVTFVRR